MTGIGIYCSYNAYSRDKRQLGTSQLNPENFSRYGHALMARVQVDQSKNREALRFMRDPTGA